jgi:hypothetical protein
MGRREKWAGKKRRDDFMDAGNDITMCGPHPRVSTKLEAGASAFRDMVQR